MSLKGQGRKVSLFRALSAGNMMGQSPSKIANPAAQPAAPGSSIRNCGRKIQLVSQAVNGQTTLHVENALRVIRESSLAFLEADTNHDEQLSWDEFLKAVAMPPDAPEAEVERLREVFDAADIDGSGFLSRDEYFLWSLTIAAEFNGRCGLESIFEKYDQSGDGLLDAAEFAAAIEDIGFGDVAHDLFIELDSDESGSVSYQEMIQTLADRVSHLSDPCKRAMTRLAFDHAGITTGKLGRFEDTPTLLNVSTWRLESNTADRLRLEILARIGEQEGARISDFCRLMADDNHNEGAGALTLAGFVAFLQRVGHVGHVDVLADIFECIDQSASHRVGTAEIFAWLSGRLVGAANTFTALRAATLLAGSGRTTLADVE